MIKYSDAVATKWSGLDVEFYLCDILDLKVKDEAGLNKYLDKVMDDILESCQEEVIQLINQAIANHVEEELVQLKKDINEFR